MTRYPTYFPGDRVHAWTFRYHRETGAPLSVHGRVIDDAGGRELTIAPDADSNFAGESPFTVHKDRLFA